MSGSRTMQGMAPPTQPSNAERIRDGVEPLPLRPHLDAPAVITGGRGALEPETLAVLRAAPELIPRFLALAEAADDDPGACAVLEALADMVADLLEPMERLQPALVACLDAVEEVAGMSPDAEDLVAWAFLDALDPIARRRLVPWFGPRTAALAAQLDESGPGSS